MFLIENSKCDTLFFNFFNAPCNRVTFSLQKRKHPKLGKICFKLKILSAMLERYSIVKKSLGKRQATVDKTKFGGAFIISF